MGFFGDFTFSGGQWLAAGGQSEPYLAFSIHDSDIARVNYAPTHGGGGLFFLGTEPRIYFEDESEEPVDRGREASGFAAWLKAAEGREVDAAHIEVLLPQDDDEEPLDVFVEKTVLRLIRLAGLPVPPQLQGQ